MSDPEILVVKIDLGIDIEEEIKKVGKSISKESKEAIAKIVDDAEQKQTEKQEAKKEKQREKDDWEDKIRSCVEVMKEADSDNPVSSDKLLEITGADKLTGLILRIKNYVKKNEGEYEIEKIRKHGKNSYYLSRLV